MGNLSSAQTSAPIIFALPAKASGENDFSLGNGVPLRSSCHVTLSLSHNKLILRCGGSIKTKQDLPVGFTNRPQIIGGASDITQREECQIKAPRRSGRGRERLDSMREQADQDIDTVLVGS